MNEDIEVGVETTLTPKRKVSRKGVEPNGSSVVKTVTNLSEFVAGASLEDRIDSLIESKGVVMFGKNACPFCLDVKDLLGSQIGVPVYVVEINEHSDGAQIFKYVKEKTGHSTVPIIFIKGEFIGGCDELKALHAKDKLIGKLDGLIGKKHAQGGSSLETAELIPMKRGTARNPPFWFPNVVNNYVVRLTGFQVFVMSILSAVFYDELWGQYLAVGLLVDFVLRMVAGSSVSPLGMIATVVSSPFKPEFRPGPPKQFAACCGVMVSEL
jgi:glutaredoxin 3